jgi:hypothetical protein
MNEDLEKTLMDAPKTGVPDSLDAKVEAVIRQSERGALPFPARRMPLWAAAAACLVCAIIGFFAGYGSVPETGEAPAGVVYVKELSGPVPSILTAETENNGTGFFQKARGEVRTIYRR